MHKALSEARQRSATLKRDGHLEENLQVVVGQQTSDTCNRFFLPVFMTAVHTGELLYLVLFGASLCLGVGGYLLVG